MLEIIGVPGPHAARQTAAWAHIGRALVHGSLDTVDALKEAALRGGVQLWLGVRGGDLVGAIVTEIVDKPLARVCVIVAAGGDGITAGGCESAIEQITHWARSLGCSQFEINGRRGWGRHLKGWALAHTTHRRSIP